MIGAVRSPRPLRLWLQSTSLLAVLAGYCLLLLLNQQTAAWQRRQAYAATLQQVLPDLTQPPPDAQELQRRLMPLRDQHPLLRLQVSLAGGAGAGSKPARLVERGGTLSMVGEQRIRLADGGWIRLELEQDVTGLVQQERLHFLLLIVAAGVASLLTSALLRLVLRRGVVAPLQRFSEELAGFQVPPRLEDRLNPALQPEELQPIAESFNQLQERLHSSWIRQQEFVDGVAHELRTPITLISGHSQRLLRDGSRAEEAEALRLIHEEAERMASLVSDLLDLARRDSGRLTLRCRPVDVEDALLQLFERMEVKAAGRLHLAPDDQGAGSAVVRADPDRLQQCLTSLVDNALLYAKPSFRVDLAWSQPEAACVILHVLDRGPGVPLEERGRIFERFVRGGAGQGSRFRGSGIGLSMVKLLIEAMGGSVSVHDRPGGGADFRLTLRAFRS